MTLTRVPVKDFRGGLNTRDSPFELSANESPDLLNVTVSSLVGQLESRKGYTRLPASGAAFGTTADYAKQVVIGSTNKRFLMVSSNGAIYAVNPAGESKLLFTGTAGTIWTFEVFADAAFKDWVYCSNGVDKYQKWDGEAAATVEWLFNGVASGAIGTILRVWENRMFISGVGVAPQRVYFSEFGDPEATIKGYGFVDVRGEEDDLDAVQDLAVLGARLIILKRRSVFFISSAVTMANRRIGGPGVWGRFQTVELEDKLYFFNPQGIWSTGGVQITMESGSINNYFPKTLNPAGLTNARLVATKDTYPRLLLAFTSKAASVNDLLLEMVPHINFRRIGGRRYLLLPAFFVHSIPMEALAAWNPTGQEETIVGFKHAEEKGIVFPEPPMPVTDSFERANENPLSNGGKWQVPSGALHIIENMLRNKAASAFEEEARWFEEFTNPVATVEIARLLNPTEEKRLGIIICQQGLGHEGERYIAEFRFEPGGVTLSIQVAAAFVTTIREIANVFGAGVTPKVGDALGFTCSEGKLYVGWRKGGKWQTLTSIADGTFAKGRSGVLMQTGTSESIGLVKFSTKKSETSFVAAGVHMYQLFIGNTDDGELIESHWHSSWMTLQGEEPKERVRRINVELQGEATLDVFTDFSAAPTFSKAIPKAVGEAGEYRFARVRPETWGRFHSVKVKSTAGSQFLINAMEVVYRGGKQP